VESRCQIPISFSAFPEISSENSTCILHVHPILS
jgi:hypothetical protein